MIHTDLIIYVFLFFSCWYVYSAVCDSAPPIYVVEGRIHVFDMEEGANNICLSLIRWLPFIHFVITSNTVHDVVKLSGSMPSHLAKTTKKTIVAFMAANHVEFFMVDYIIPNVHGVLHPIDEFASDLFDMFNKKAKTICFSTYHRTNAVLRLKLDYLLKFFRGGVIDLEAADLFQQSLDELFTDVVNRKNFHKLRRRLSGIDRNSIFDAPVVGSSAAGYPYKSGVKRRDVKADAEYKAKEMYDDDEVFQSYLTDHVWYTAGRAKLQDIAKESARLICYPGFAFMLLTSVYYSNVMWFFHEEFEWFGVGFSWMNGGAAKLANILRADKGVAPEAYEFCSVDAKEWDTSLSSILLYKMKNFHMRLMDYCGVPSRFIYMFGKLYDCMVSAIILLPMGFAVRVYKGMKSGFAGTADDNTNIHRAVFRGVLRFLHLSVDLPCVLYGDDNIFLKPVTTSDDDIIAAYAKFGIIIKEIHSSSHLNDVSFLSKRIIYMHGEYFPYRASIETFSRLLNPEEMHPSYNEVPQHRRTAERLLGHLIDNFYNVEVRVTIYKMLRYLKNKYHINEVEFDPSKYQSTMFRFMDVKRLAGVIPIVPDESFIRELYGVHGHGLSMYWPSLVPDIVYDPNKLAKSLSLFESALNYYDEVKAAFRMLSRKGRIRVRNLTSPYASISGVKGTHAARFEWAMHYFGLNSLYQGKSVKFLDIGSHPGAVARSMLKFIKAFITCITKIPDHDINNPMPYVLLQDRLKVIFGDIDDQDLGDQHFDLIHDDLDLVDKKLRPSGTNIAQSKSCLDRFIKFCGNTDRALMTVHDLDVDTIEKMYECYSAYGSIDIHRSRFSNPWRPEYMVLFTKTKNSRMKKKKFLHSMYHYFNAQTSFLIQWNQVLHKNVMNAFHEGVVERNPLQSDDAYKAESVKWVL